ncbi:MULTISPECIES: O-fucosyltransferase family protein [Prevotellaceae]|uniref:hypothetical protein n=1 Tax=Prevotellaceae TaxID=171552 RepID=UPI0003D3158D|nr:hypothetical protein [Prevotella phocaeensis]ETD21588.1 hypothetical protein HMPREF1199_00663 [Hoylesella oralis CC98A]
MRAKYWIAYLLDLSIREPRLILKYYKPFSFSVHKPVEERFVFMADGRFPHGGMFDRLKGAISVYAVSKVRGKEFKLNFSSPFCLEKYLRPNQYNWTIDKKELDYHYPSSRPLFLYGECSYPRRLVKNRKCEAHFYYGYDSLDYLSAKYGVAYDWGELYNELFRPTIYLQKYIDFYKKDIGKDYIVLHFRFLNLLGDHTEFNINPTLCLERRRELMELSVGEMKRIIEEYPYYRIMLATDSNCFTEYVREMLPDVYIVPGEIRHIGTANETNDTENVKMFIDYYLIAGAKKVYNIVAPGMWKSAFPEYAAKIGGAEFERIIIS